MSITVKWQQNLEFLAITKQGHTIEFDANGGVAPCPTEVLLSALGSCSATDVVMGLQEAEFGLQSVSNQITYTYTDSEPKLYKTVNLYFSVTAAKVSKTQVEEIVEQAINKYCHVCLMLQPSMEISFSVDVTST